MSALSRARRNRRWRCPRSTVRLHVETLEPRSLPTAISWPGLLHPVGETEPNDTLDRAQDLGNLSVTSRAEVVGNIGQGAAGPADVDWYQFALTAPAEVHLATLDSQGGSALVSTLSLYNSDPLPPPSANSSYNDAFDPLHHRLLAQDDGAQHGGDASLDRLLGPGTYYVAVSGSGDRYFNPFLAGSGNNGSTGNYGLLLTTTATGIAATDGPTVLTTAPAPGSILDQSPFVIRLDLSEALKASSIMSGRTVKLITNPHGTFGDGHDSIVSLAAVQFSTGANELQIIPRAPLGPGFYKVFLAGNNSLPRMPFLVDPAGNPLGKNAAHPHGADYSLTFQINGIDGVAGAATPDDTLATARDLNDITDAGLVQVAGAVGVDPTDPARSFNPAAVELYHFQIHGAGQFAFSAEVFAGRIGSPVDAAVTLFEMDDRGTLHLIGDNDNSFNATTATDGISTPLLNDPLLFAGLQAGDYYLAVSSSGNFPDPTQPVSAWQPGPQANGSFDPTHSHSTTMPVYTSVGAYVLNLAVRADNTAPTVVTATPTAGADLAVPPTQLVVQFSKPVLLAQLAGQNFFQSGQTPGTVPAVFIQGTTDAGTSFGPYYPRFQSFDEGTDEATFLMMDGLPNGVYQLHLSGAQGLTDFAGNPLVGNDPSGDYVTTFTVHDPARGNQGDIENWTSQEPNDDPGHPQVIGPLFPNELSYVGTDPNTGNSQDGVEFSGTITPGPGGDHADYYEFQALQSQVYLLNLLGSGIPAGALTLTDTSGNAIPLDTSGAIPQVSLNPDTYIVGVDWTSNQVGPVSYQLQISVGMSPESPAPLAVGPAPAYRISLAPPPPVQNPPTPPVQNPTPPPVQNTPTPPSQNPTPTPVQNPTPPAQNPTPSPVQNTPTPPVQNPTPPVQNPTPPVQATPPGNAQPPESSPTPTPIAAPTVNTPVVGPVSSPTPPASVVTPNAPPEASLVPVVSRINLSAPAAASSESTISVDVLALFRAVPVGGVRGPGTSDTVVAPERVVLHSADTPPLDVPVRFIILAQPPSPPSSLSGGDSPRAENPEPANQNPGDHPMTSDAKKGPRSVPPWLNLWKQALDEFFRINWSGRFLQEMFQSLPMMNLGVKPSNAAGRFEDNIAEEDLEAAFGIPAGHDGFGGSTLGWAGAAVFPALALLVHRDPKRSRHLHLAARRIDRNSRSLLELADSTPERGA